MEERGRPLQRVEVTGGRRDAGATRSQFEHHPLYFENRPMEMNCGRQRSNGQRAGGHATHLRRCRYQPTMTSTNKSQIVVGGRTRQAGGQGDKYWIGGSYSKKDGGWKWSDGSPIESSKWASGQPDNREGDENCLATNLRSTERLVFFYVYSLLMSCSFRPNSYYFVKNFPSFPISYDPSKYGRELLLVSFIKTAPLSDTPRYNSRGCWQGVKGNFGVLAGC